MDRRTAATGRRTGTSQRPAADRRPKWTGEDARQATALHSTAACDSEGSESWHPADLCSQPPPSNPDRSHKDKLSDVHPISAPAVGGSLVRMSTNTSRLQSERRTRLAADSPSPSPTRLAGPSHDLQRAVLNRRWPAGPHRTSPVDAVVAGWTTTPGHRRCWRTPSPRVRGSAGRAAWRLDRRCVSALRTSSPNSSESRQKSSVGARVITLIRSLITIHPTVAEFYPTILGRPTALG